MTDLHNSRSNSFASQGGALLIIVAQILILFSFSGVAKAETTGITVNDSTLSTLVGQQVNFVVSTTFTGSTTPGTEIVLQDNGGGSFYNGTNAGLCNSASPDGDSTFLIDKTKGVCYSNPTPGSYKITVFLVSSDSVNIGAPLTIDVEVTEPTPVVVDTDNDTVPDATDNCPLVENTEQVDSNDNGVGDACEPAVVEDPVGPATAVIEACKFSTEESPIAGWEMTISSLNNSYTVSTGNDGCVRQSVSVVDGPWLVVEEEREGYEQVEVVTDELYGEIVATDSALEEKTVSACQFLAPRIDARSSSSSERQYRCVFFNRVPVDPVPTPTTCTLRLVSDGTDFVVEKNGAAKLLSFIHSNWIGTIASSTAAWIWGDNPVNLPTSVDETQTFKKSFNWTGGTTTSAILTIASDNSHAIKLGSFTGGNAGEVNFIATKDYNVTAAIVPGLNQLEITVKNFGVAGSNQTSNPAGLLYQLTLTGTNANCGEVITVEPEPVDICLNLAGVQTVVPKGYVLEGVGQCVAPENPVVNTCLIPNTLGATSTVPIRDENNEKTIGETFADYGYTFLDILTSQKGYQVWNLTGTTTETVTFTLRVIGKQAGNVQILGYYKTGSTTTFTTVLTQTTNTNGEPAVAVSVPAELAQSFGFAIKSGGKIWYTETALNADGKDHVAVYNPANNVYLLAFEDLNNLGDGDYNDLVIKVDDIKCVARAINNDEDEEDNGDNGDGGDGNDEEEEEITTTPIVDNGNNGRGGGNSGTLVRRALPTPTVAGESISAPVPTPMVLGEQVSAVPYGAAGAGSGGAANNQFAALVYIAIFALIALFRREIFSKVQ